MGNEILDLRPRLALLMRWEERFEKFLREKQLSDERMRDYRSYFKRFLEGGVLSESFLQDAKVLPPWGERCLDIV